MNAAHSIKGSARQRGPQGLPHTPESGPDTSRNVLLSALPARAATGNGNLGEAERLASEPPPPPLPAWPCFCFSSQRSLCGSWGQEPACSCGHRHAKETAWARIKNLAGKSHRGVSPNQSWRTPGSRELSVPVTPGLQGPWQDLKLYNQRIRLEAMPSPTRPISRGTCQLSQPSPK